jgi:3-oxoacyl-[acyl-carrier-protein] synthase I
MSSVVSIAAAGARTPLGLRAAPSAAALRSGISGVGMHPFMIDRVGDPMPAVLDARLDPRMPGPERMLALAASAVREACTLLGETPYSRLRLPLYLALPELRPGFSQSDVETVSAAIGQLPGLPVEISTVQVVAQGHAAGLLALAAATDWIRQGALEAALVGGVDSYFVPDTMEWLDDNRQLAGADARSAFVPGEAAGFCLLMTERARERLGLPELASVLSVGLGRETKLIKTSDICLGEGLTATVQAAFAALPRPNGKVNEVICDINGERYRGEEWGFVCLRLGEHFDDPTTYRSPADCWGDVGAASGPLFVMLACEAAARRYAGGPRTMVWASSEGGLRGAAMLGFGST